MTKATADDPLAASPAITKSDFGFFEIAAFGTADQLDAMLKEDPKRIAERTPFGWTALHIGAFAGNAATTELLVGRGAEVNARPRKAGARIW